MPFILPIQSKTQISINSGSWLTLRHKIFCLFILLTLITPVKSVLAEETISRYTMIESKNGIIRLDKKTGALSNCKKSADGWTCRAIKETNEVNKKTGADNNQDNTDELFSELQKENEALKKENLNLKQQIANLELGLEGEPTKKKLKLPTDEEVDEAITYMEKMIRKFGGAMKRLREKHPDVPGTEL